MKQTAAEWLLQLWLTNERFERVILIEQFEQAKEMEKEQMIGFHKWMLENDTPENAERFFHFSDTDMLNEYLKAQKL